MNYLFLAYQNEEQWADLAASERELIDADCLSYEQELRQRKYLLAVEDFQNNQSVITVQLVEGEVTLVEGVHSGQKGQLNQLFLIRARDLNEALQVVSKMPQLQRGSVEVRPMLNVDWLSPAD